MWLASFRASTFYALWGRRGKFFLGRFGRPCLRVRLACLLLRRFQAGEQIVQRSFFRKLDDEFLVGIWERVAHKNA
jgi:hypothetical protein